MQYILEQIVTFIQWTGITPKEIVDSLIIYIFVRLVAKGYKAVNSEAGQIIRTHHKNSHRSSVRGCREGDCVRLVRQDSAEVQEQLPVVVLPQEY